MQTYEQKPTTGKPYKGLPMEGIIASWYANIRRTDPDLMPLVERVTQLFPQGSRLLEIAPGPGYLSIELARRGFNVTGVDISHSFVEMAQAKAHAAGVAVEFRQGNASQLPLPDNTFDFTVCRAAFKNFSDPLGAINEMRRVLKPGGKALINDLRSDASPQEIAAHIASMDMNPVNAYMTKWTFEHMLLKSAYTLPQMRQLAADSSFGGGELIPDAIGFELWLTR